MHIDLDNSNTDMVGKYYQKIGDYMNIDHKEYNQIIDGLHMQLTLQRRFISEQADHIKTQEKLIVLRDTDYRELGKDLNNLSVYCNKCGCQVIRRVKQWIHSDNHGNNNQSLFDHIP